MCDDYLWTKLASGGSCRHLARMDVSATLATTAAFVGLTAFAAWRGARPPNLVKGPRMIPWRMVMVVSAAVVLYLLVHLAALAGLYHDRY